MKKKLLYNEVIIKQKNKYNIEKINNIFDKSFNKNKNSILTNNVRIKTKYRVDDKKIIKIFGNYFFRNNKNKCYISYEGKKHKLVEYLEIKNNNIRKIEIELIGINNIIDLREMFF